MHIHTYHTFLNFIHGSTHFKEGKSLLCILAHLFNIPVSQQFIFLSIWSFEFMPFCHFVLTSFFNCINLPTEMQISATFFSLFELNYLIIYDIELRSSWKSLRRLRLQHYSLCRVKCWNSEDGVSLFPNLHSHQRLSVGVTLTI